MGTVLTLGPHLLSVTFTPTDTTDYTSNTATVAITVSSGTGTYDTGKVSFVTGTTTLATVSYGQGSTAATVASALAAAVNAVSGTPVTLIALDDALYITAVTPGVAGDSISYSISNTGYDTTDFSAASFPSATISGNLDGGGTSGTDGGKVVYSYSDSYDHVGNMVGSNDLVMGSGTFTPDTLNRLSSATNLPVSSSATNYYCWSYDSFGNRSLQGVSTAAFASGPPACTPQSSASYEGVWAHIASNNRFSNTQQAMAGVAYDGAGNILNDGVNQYLYDGEGRICAVATEGSGPPVMTGYIYNAEGQRVGKGTITSWSCDPTANGYQAMSDFILGPSGEQVTEMGMKPGVGMAWQHTNVYALGQLIATYDNNGLHFYLNDSLGTRRAQTDYAGVLEQTCASLPFGDALNCTNSLQSPTEHHFTGKERDAESGNDYFGARYYASSMGRFMSPDWSDYFDPVPYANLQNPQTLNLYSYVQNNPLSRRDATGHYSCAPDTVSTNAHGDTVVTAGACHFDLSDLPQIAVAVGHHFLPQRMFQKWDPSSYAYKVANRATTGPLSDKTANYNDTLQRLNNKAVEDIVEKYLTTEGKQAQDLTAADLRAIKDEINAATGSIADFNARMESTNPGVRTAEDAIEHAIQVVGESPAGQFVEETVQECGGGACPIP